jgi:putative DNA primase/helicase
MQRLLTLKQLSEAKRLPLDHLRGLGLADSPEGGVSIPYFDESGLEIATKRRLRLDLKDRADAAPCVWPTRTPIAAYGQWLLDRAARAGYLILVEGESDCWTLWYHDFPALGLPGSYTASTLTAEHVARVQKVYVWREPDTAGNAFLTGVYLRLRKLNFRGTICEASANGVKDPSELHAQEPQHFKERFRAALDEAHEMKPEGVARGVPEQSTTRLDSTSSALPGCSRARWNGSGRAGFPKASSPSLKAIPTRARAPYSSTSGRA